MADKLIELLKEGEKEMNFEKHASEIWYELLTYLDDELVDFEPSDNKDFLERFLNAMEALEIYPDSGSEYDMRGHWKRRRRKK